MFSILYSLTNLGGFYKLPVNFPRPLGQSDNDMVAFDYYFFLTLGRYIPEGV